MEQYFLYQKYRVFFFVGSLQWWICIVMFKIVMSFYSDCGNLYIVGLILFSFIREGVFIMDSYINNIDSLISNYNLLVQFIVLNRMFLIFNL